MSNRSNKNHSTQKDMAEIKEPIRIRRKKLTNGNVSLYLDIYLNGKREYEFLKLYLIPEKTKADREANRQTLQLANSIKARRIVEVQNGEHGFKSAYASDTLFFDYYRAMCARRLGAESTGNWGNWKSCLKHLQKYEPNERIRFSQITQEWVQGFRDYLEKDACAWSCDERDRIKDHPLSRNSRVSYFNKLRACINQAYDERIIPINPLRGIEGFKAEEVKRDYLTLEEVRLLAATPCRYPMLKRAFLFSCLTGLRKSDIQKLTWGEIQKFGEYMDEKLIFSRFYRPSERVKGNGLGLSIVKAVCDYHGWNISYAYSEGKHRFAVRFP